MDYYAGFDVSEEATSICVIDGRGAVVGEAKVVTGPEALAGWLARWGGMLALVGLEAGALSPWLARELEALGCRWW